MSPKRFAGRTIHFVGTGGSGMSGLAEFVLNEGACVSGSDMKASEATQRLARLGATIHVGHAAENVPAAADTVVASAAVKPENVELLEACRRDIRVEKYAAFLGRLMALRQGIAVSGCHGKSTTTALVGYILLRSGLDPSVVVGAHIPQLGGSSRVGRGPHFVAEACEYDRSFHNLCPRAACVLNIDDDHRDTYPGGMPEIQAAFRTFAQRVPPDGLLVVNGADPHTRTAMRAADRPAVTFGIGGDYDWRAENLEGERGRFAFDVYRGRALYARIRLAIAGRHNVLNALAATALANWAGARAGQVAEALAGFTGAARRMQVLGEVGGVTVVDDYAHHPTEIVATLTAVREWFQPRRLWVVFQPHQHSRTRHLLKDFALALAHADKTIVPDIYFVRDSEAERQAVRSQDLVAQIQAFGRDALYLEPFDSIRRYLVESLSAGDVLLVMGAGDVWRLAQPVLDGLAAQHSHAAPPPSDLAARTPDGHLQGT
jgi:UDP-N-acetylmuramate--alanine ligase